jgi:thymidylate synthase (FAD)
MEVNLISITEAQIFSSGSAEELIAYCARVSNPENQMNNETAPRLLKFLIKHKHWSPFEMVDMCVEIKTSRAIAAQILRHRSFSFQEFSQRYSAATEIEPIELRKQADKNRQSSAEVIDEPVINNVVKYAIDHAVQTYEKLLTQGVAKEQARMVLPLATQSTLYMKGSVRSWVHYLDLRSEENTQKEHRDIANAIKDIFKVQFPVVSEALGWIE